MLTVEAQLTSGTDGPTTEFARSNTMNFKSVVTTTKHTWKHLETHLYIYSFASRGPRAAKELNTHQQKVKDPDDGR